MLARRLTTSLLATTLAAAVDLTPLPRVEGLTSGRTALITTRLFRGGLCDAMAMSTGNSGDGKAVRERHPTKMMSRTRLTCIGWRRWRGG
jgi:hypothetical protein